MLFKDKTLLCVGLVLLGIFSRFLPHEYNFAPIAATGLFAAAYLRPRGLALGLPVAALFVSDLLLYFFTNQPGYSAGFVLQRAMDYGALALVGLASGFLFRQKRDGAFYLQTAGMAVLGSAAFFLISNFAVWLQILINPAWMQGVYYAPNLGGLLDCYVLALPFYKGTFAGDLLYAALFFGAAYLAIERKTQPAQA